MNSVIFHDVSEPFDFEKLSLNPPMVVSGGNYFIKYSINGGPLYIQIPECKTKGTIAKSSKKPYCDLMFSQENTHFIKWMEDLESETCKKIFEKREDWFDTEMDLADIENYFATPLKSYKSGKFYLARTFIPSHFGKITLKIYNENKELIDIDSIVDNTSIMGVLEIQGVKCSARSFQIEMEMKQIMTLKPVNLFESCVLSSRRPVIQNEASNEEEVLEEPEVQENIHMELEDTNTLEETQEIPAQITEETIENISLEEKPEELKTLDDLEFNVNLEELDKNDLVTIKPHNDIYYQRYHEAQKRARIAKNLALQAYLEAKEIKNKYQLDDIDSDDDDFFNNDEPEELEAGDNI